MLPGLVKNYRRHVLRELRAVGVEGGNSCYRREIRPTKLL